MQLSDLLSFELIAIQCHDNPDADALASGFGLYSYFTARGRPPRLFYSGRAPISKPNLLEMTRALGIPVAHEAEPAPVEGLLITVDCQYGAGNVTPVPADTVAVLDHHVQEKDLPELCDLRPFLGSCATLVWDLLVAQNHKPDTALATALHYGLYTDTGGFAEVRHPMDRDMWDSLEPDRRTIKKLIRSNLSLGELSLAAASLNSLVYDGEDRFALMQASPCDPNILGVISDLAMQVDSVDTALAYFQNSVGIKFSVRTATREAKAAELAAWLTAGGIGSGGGHGEKAGGFINAGKFQIAHAGLPVTEYFAQRLRLYSRSYTLIDCTQPDAGRLADAEGMALYRKLPTPVGYVPCAGLFPAQTTLHVRMREADMDIRVEEDTVLMIGVTGEVYPIKKEKFTAVYTPTKQEFAPKLEYAPVVVNNTTGIRVPLLSVAKSCVGRGGIVRAKRLEHGVKVFTRWNEDVYLRGEPGDWLVAHKDDPTDLYVVTAPVFPLLYAAASSGADVSPGEAGSRKRDCTGLDVASCPEAVEVMKRPLPGVAARFAREAGQIDTREGTVNYQTGDALLTGVEGEEWPVTRERFLASYTPLPPTGYGKDGMYAKKALRVWGLRMRGPFCVRVGDNMLSGDSGDWLIQYGPDEYGIVEADIFATTYFGGS